MKKREEQHFSFLDLAAALVKEAHIHEGFWELSFHFMPIVGMKANFKDADKPMLLPSACVPIRGVSLVRVEQLNDLAVDASVVNPRKGLVELTGVTH